MQDPMELNKPGCARAKQGMEFWGPTPRFSLGILSWSPQELKGDFTGGTCCGEAVARNRIPTLAPVYCCVPQVDTHPH